MSAACHSFTCSMAPSGWVQELEEPDFHHFFVKKTCTLAMDKHDRCNLCIVKQANLVLMPLISLSADHSSFYAMLVAVVWMPTAGLLTLQSELQLCREMTMAPHLPSALRKQTVPAVPCTA